MGFFGSSDSKESTCNAGDLGSKTLGRKILWRRDRLPTPVFLGFPVGSDCKESAYNVGVLGSISGSGDPLEESMATHSDILAWKIPMDRGTWQAIVHGVTKSWT